MTKLCPLCGIVSSSFGKDVHRKDGHRWSCKECEAKKKKEYRQTAQGKAQSKKDADLFRARHPNHHRRYAEQRRAYNKQWKIKLKATEDGVVKLRRIKMASIIRAKYGMTLADYDWRLREQGNRCAICNGLATKTKALALDHDHRTHRVRMFLCDCCNRGLGMFRDNIQVLRKAVLYLEKHQPSQIPSALLQKIQAARCPANRDQYGQPWGPE